MSMYTIDCWLLVSSTYLYPTVRIKWKLVRESFWDKIYQGYTLRLDLRLFAGFSFPFDLLFGDDDEPIDDLRLV